MEGENYLITAFWRLLMSAGFAASFVAVAAYLLIPQVPLAIIAGGVIGLPTGIAASSAKTAFRAMARAAGIWAVILGILLAFVAYQSGAMHGPAENIPPYLAFVASVVSIASLGAGCSQIFCRAIAPEVGQASRFQFSLAEAVAISMLFATCLGCAIWWKQLAPALFEILANPGFHMSPKD